MDDPSDNPFSIGSSRNRAPTFGNNSSNASGPTPPPLGTNSEQASSSPFSAPSSSQAPVLSLFGSNPFAPPSGSQATPLFGTNSEQTSSSNIFASSGPTPPPLGTNSEQMSSSPFSAPSTSQAPAPSLFGSNPFSAPPFGSQEPPRFGTNSEQASSSNIFAPPSGSRAVPLFGSQRATPPSFGGNSGQRPTPLFGSKPGKSPENPLSVPKTSLGSGQSNTQNLAGNLNKNISFLDPHSQSVFGTEDSINRAFSFSDSPKNYLEKVQEIEKELQEIHQKIQELDISEERDLEVALQEKNTLFQIYHRQSALLSDLRDYCLEQVDHIKASSESVHQKSSTIIILEKELKELTEKNQQLSQELLTATQKIQNKEIIISKLNLNTFIKAKVYKDELDRAKNSIKENRNLKELLEGTSSSLNKLKKETTQLHLSTERTKKSHYEELRQLKQRHKLETQNLRRKNSELLEILSTKQPFSKLSELEGSAEEELVILQNELERKEKQLEEAIIQAKNKPPTNSETLSRNYTALVFLFGFITNYLVYSFLN